MIALCNLCYRSLWKLQDQDLNYILNRSFSVFVSYLTQRWYSWMFIELNIPYKRCEFKIKRSFQVSKWLCDYQKWPYIWEFSRKRNLINNVHVLFLCVFLHIQVADFNVYMDQIYICWNILDINYIEDFIFKLIILI